MISTKESEICNCSVVHRSDTTMERCIGAVRKHKICGREILDESRMIIDDRPKVEYR